MSVKRSVVGSPCISVCVLNEDDVCQGCWRSAKEITNWNWLDDDERLAVLKEVKERFKQYNKHQLL